MPSVGRVTHRRAGNACGRAVAACAWVVLALRNGAEVWGRMVKGKGWGKLLRGERKCGHAQGMLTHRRARLARGRGRTAREWVVRALRNGAEVRGRMVKGEGDGAGCGAGSEKGNTRRAC